MLDYKGLVSSALAGDTISIYALYTNSFQAVWSVIREKAVNIADARLLACKAFTTSFKNLKRLEYPEEFPVWMNSIAECFALHYEAANEGSGTESAGLQGRQRMQAPLSPDLELMNEIWEDVRRCLSGEEPGPCGGEASCAETLRDIECDFEALEIMTKIGAYKHRRKKRIALFSLLAVLLICIVAILFAVLRPTRGSRYSFPNVLTTLSDEKMMKFAYAISGQLAGQIGEIYQISDKQYYLVLYLNGDLAGGAMVSYEEGSEEAQLLAASDTALTEAQLKSAAEDPYMQLDFNSLPKDSEPSHQAASEAGSTELYGEDNNLALSGSDMEGLLEKAIKEKEKWNALFNIQDEGDFSVTLKIKCRNVDLAKPVIISLDSSIADMLGEQGDLQIIINDELHSIFMTREQLQGLCDAYGRFSVRLHALSSRNYNIGFFDSRGREIEQLYGDMDFTLPADSEATYVYASYEGGSENRGGIYDARLGTITFPVYLSGNYELIGNVQKVRDLHGLSEEESAALEFVASRNFFELDANGNFNPDGEITRALFVQILGRMFLLTNESSESSFTDMDKSNPAYVFITTGKDISILSGYSDGSFGAEFPATREVMITLCSRTLVYRQASDYPQGKEEETALAGFKDAANIAQYARASVALAASEGLIESSGYLRPKENATRLDAALILAKMYRMLYDSP